MNDNIAVARAATFQHRMRVYWEDTDAGGIVFYANYLRFFERARTEWLRSLGIGQQQLLDRDGLIFIVESTQLRFVHPARLDDVLDLGTQLRALGRASLVLDQTALRGRQLLAQSSSRIACVQAGSLKVRRIPSQILDQLK